MVEHAAVPGSDPSPEISVVVPTFGRRYLLDRLLDALEAQTVPYERFEVVIVDDCSPDGSATHLQARAQESPLRLHVLSTPRNAGPALARNLGWRHASAPLLAFTDDDCVPEPDWLERGLEALLDDDSIGVVQGVTRAGPGPQLRWTVRREIAAPTAWFEACNVFYRRGALEETGGFDEEIRWFGEDAAAGWKVLDAGWGRDFEPAAAVVHDLEDRGMAWRVRHALLERNLVELALRHPELRRDWFWRPWSFDAKAPLVAAAVLSAAAGLRWRPAALGVLPYLWRRRHVIRRDPVLAAGVAVVDVAQVAGHLAGSVPHRTIVL